MKTCFTCFILLFFLFQCAAQNAHARATQYQYKHKSSPNVERGASLTEDLGWDLSIGGSLYEGMLHQLDADGIAIDLPSDKELINRLNRIMKQIKNSTQMSDLPYQVHLVDSDISNAGCYPGGYMIFFKGIFDLNKKGLIDPQSDDEIAAVMAHEMSHASLRHSYKAVKVAQRTLLIAKLASFATGALGGAALQSLFNSLFNLTANVVFPKYSRLHEDEADLEGLYLSLASGFEPEASVSLWKRAMERGGSNAKRTGIYASHPSNRTRMETLEKKVKIVREMQKPN